MNCSFRPRSLALALAVGLLSAAGAHAAEVCLVAKSFGATGQPGGLEAGQMWGYALAPWSGVACTWASAGQATSPGPRITVPPTDTTLTIHLKNELPVPTSIIIPGLPSPGTPSRHTTETTRATSFTAEVLAGTASTTPYTWTVSRPGTFLYQSGSHVQVQVQMGLYGAVTKNAVDAVPEVSLAQAYAGKAYASEVVLFYSEIDPTLHQAVAEGGYGGLLPIPGTQPPNPTTPTMTSTYNYKPRFFLVNGDTYTPGRAPETAGGPGETTLIRFLNAGLRTHVPTLLNGDFELVAEDAHPYGYSRRQQEVSLFAGKTMDVLWTPAFAGTYTVYDRSPHLTTDGDGPGGMIVKLLVAGTVTAVDDTYGARNDKPLVVPAPGVMGNDSAISTATLVTGLPGDGSQGTLVFNSDGSFTYTAPAAFAGSVTFTYQQPSSAIATVTINVSANLAPQAIGANVTTAEDTAVAITLQATDANSDALTYAIATPPLHGALTGTPPNVTYTPDANYNGLDSFTFTASDDQLTSTPATVSITVTPVNDAPTATSATVGTAEDTAVPITLAGADIDGDPLSFTITSPPANGMLSAITQVPPTSATVTYTPKLNWNGTDSFRFVTTDGQGGTSPVATITIPVTPVPDNPIAANDTYTTKYNVTTTLDVLANDKDPDGTPLTINNSPVVFPKCFNSTTGAPVTPCTTTTTGVDKVTINSTANRLTFVPNSAVRGNRTIVFTYEAKDSGGALSAAATVTVNVTRR